MVSELHVGQRRVRNHNPKFKSNLLSVFMAGRYRHSSAEQCTSQMFVYEVQMCVVPFTTSLQTVKKQLLVAVDSVDAQSCQIGKFALLQPKCWYYQYILISLRSEQRKTMLP